MRVQLTSRHKCIDSLHLISVACHIRVSSKQKYPKNFSSRHLGFPAVPSAEGHVSRLSGLILHHFPFPLLSLSWKWESIMRRTWEVLIVCANWFHVKDNGHISQNGAFNQSQNQHRHEGWKWHHVISLSQPLKKDSDAVLPSVYSHWGRRSKYSSAKNSLFWWKSLNHKPWNIFPVKYFLRRFRYRGCNCIDRSLVSRGMSFLT